MAIDKSTEHPEHSMKERIKEQSIRLFEKKGFSDTSIQDIVDALGVTKGTFYYYYSSKEELLMDIHVRYIEDLLAQQEAILNDPSMDSQAKLYEMVYLLIRKIERQGPSARVFFREMRHLCGENLERIKAKRDQVRHHVQRVLEEGVKRGELRKDLDVEIAAFGVLGMANWSYQWFNPNGRVPDRDVARMFADMILYGMEGGDGRS